MYLRILGCSGGIGRSSRTSSFLVDDDLLIDAGTGVSELSLEAMQRIDHVFLTHSHMDHVAGLPLLVDAVGGLRSRPLTVHALDATIDALRTHIFNNLIWPDFSVLPTPERPYLRWQPLYVGDVLELGGRRIEALPATHTVPTVGYAVAPLGAEGRAGAAAVFSGDSDADTAFWERLNELEVGHLFIDTAFSDEQAHLARLSGHLCPAVLSAELRRLSPHRRYPIHITHTKPSQTPLILRQVQAHIQAVPELAHRLPDIAVLIDGQTFEMN